MWNSLRRLNGPAIRVRAVQFFALLLLLLLAGEFGQAQAAISLVQTTSKDHGTTTSGSLAFTSPNTAGNWIAVCIRGGLSSTQVFTVKDSNGNTYKQAAQIGFTASLVTSAIYYAENIKGGANTVTVTMTVSGPLRYAILEYSGVATSSSFDAAVAATGSSSSPNSGNLTTTANGDLLLGNIASTNTQTFTAGNGYKIRDFVPAEPNTKLITEDQIQTAAGSASASASISSSDSWGAILAAFKPVGGVAGVPASIAATAGTPQNATVNTAFATQLQATVKDSFNSPVSGATVTFAAPGSGASGTFAGGVTTATTNASGVATAAVFTANTTAGSYMVTASVSGVSSPANFSMTNLAGAAATISATAGTPQSVAVNTAFATQLQATVKDSFNNPVSGATVTFAAPGSGASGTFAGGVTTATTNASGVATAAVFTANTTAGTYTVTASVSGVSTPANFSLTNLAGGGASIAATAGTPQSATVNTAFATQLQAAVKDSFNNPVSGATVAFAAPGSGASGTFAGGVTTATTNTSGVATAAVFTANTTAGTYTVTASVSGVSTPANFSLTNLTGAAASISVTAGTPQSATINTAFATQLQTTVKDSFGNSVSGVLVTFTAPASGASGTFAGGVNTATTNASGVATAPVFTANSIAGGPYTVTASVSGVATPANFSLTNLGNPPANIVATAGTPQSATINTAFAAQLQVTVTDSSSNPVSGVTVTFTAPASGASGTFAGGVNTATTNASGVATSAVFTANSVAGGPYTVTAAVSGVATPANFSMTNLTGAAASISATAGTPQSATVNTAYTTQFQATVKDAGNNPVSGVTVTFIAPGSGASGTFAGGVNTATTNSQGVATAAVFTANGIAGGPYNVSASVAGVAAPANFALTNLAGPAASIAATAGTPQSATVNTAFATQLQATVTDSLNNPVSGLTVTFTAPASGASGTFTGGVSTTTATTNASGVATAPVFTANATAGGPNTVTASVSGVATPANFSLTNLASVAANIALVQHAGLDAGSTTTGSLAFASSNTAGNFIAVAIRGGLSSAQVFTVKDSSGNTYKQAAQVGYTGSAVTSAIYYAENIKGGANTVTVSMTVSGPLRFDILEYSGVATSSSLDVTAVGTATSSSPLTASVNTTVNGDLLLGTVGTTNAATFTAGAGYSIRDFVPAEPNTKHIGEDQIQATAGAATAGATLAASDSWGAVLAAFKPAGGGGGAGIPASIAATAGTPQSATVNTAFAIQLQATVKDSLNNPVSGAIVTFVAPGSGASGTFAGGVTTATTNASGVATAAVFTANTIAGGPYTVTASVSGVATPANFSLTNLTGAAASISATAGTPQSATINTAFATQLQATVKDAFNNAVSGVTVTFTAPTSGASGTFAGGVNTATTNASGVATAPIFTANSTVGGPYTVTGSVSGIGTTANFSLTNLAAPPTSITATGGTPQSATVNTAFTTALQATVKDASNNPVSGVTVTFTAPGSGASGTFAGGVNTATTNSLGIATAAVFTANSIAGGPYIVTATVSGVATPANFSLTNLAGAAASITATAGTPQSATINTAFPTQLQATVTDSLNNPVSAVAVTFTAPASGPSGTFAGGVNTATTNAQGVATAPVFTANGTSGGPYTVTATVSGVATSANFSLTNLVSAPPIALVQHTSIDAGTATTASLAFTTGNTSGNWIAVAIRGGNSSSQTFTVSDSNANTYKQAAQVGFSGSAVTLAIYYAENIKGGANTLTVSMTVSGPLRFAILEFSGVATASSLDGTAAVATGASSSPNSGNLTTTANGDLLLGAIASTNSATFTAGTGYTITDFVPAEPNTKLISEDQIQSTGGVASASASLGASDNWGAILAAFKPAVLVAGSPANITATAGTPQSATVNTAFTTQLLATVKDSFNNPVNGVTVTFTAPASGASGTFAGGVNTATTNASGVATAPVFTANATAGAYTVTASVSGVSTPANFSLTNLAGAAASITATAGTPQSAAVNTAFTTQLQATVKDSFNNPVSGVTVTFAAPGSGASGTFAAGVNTATTNASGVATAPVFTANGTVGGPYTVTGSVSGVATPANFSLTNLSAPPASITATAGTPQSATINTAFTTALQATVKDSSNNPVSGVTVTFTAPASGASGTFAGGVNTAITNSVGVATSAVFTANSVAGTYTVTASVSGVATPASFSLTNLAGAPASIAATGGTPQSAAINTAFASQLQATVSDSFNNPVSGVLVTFTTPASGASGTFAGGVNTATTNASGVATAPVFTANGTTGGPYTVTASVSGVATSANFSLTNLPTSTVITLVQHTSIDAGTTTTASLAFKTNNTGGNWIAICIRGGNSSSQVFTVTDSNGNNYRQAFQLGLNANGVTFALYYAENIKAGANTVTVSQTISGPFRFAILEYSGIATSSSLDATPATAQGNSTAPNTGNITTLSNGDLLLATIITQNAGTFTAGSGYTIEEFVPAEPNTKLVAEDRIQTTAGSASAGVSLAASDNWGAGIAAFRSAGVAAPLFTVNLSPTTANLPTGYGTQNFTASVTNDFQHLGVAWSLSGAGCSGTACGTLSNVTTASVTYTAPANVPSPATATLTATSVGNNTSTASATITVTQGVLDVAVSPKRAAVTMSATQTVQFAVAVYNDPSNSGATLQVDGNTGGNATTGTISTTGLYTPGTQPGLHTITAISNANASVSATATVAVTDLTGVYIYHNDIQRTGQNLQEYALTTSTVNSSTFSALFSCPVDGYLFASPLYVANLTVGAQTRNVVFLATSHDSVYAFDADSPSCVHLWNTSGSGMVSFLSPGVTTVPLADVNDTAGDMFPEIGITSTPVIDPSSNTIYVEAKTKDTVSPGCSTTTPCYFHHLHALDLVTGAEKFGGPVVITATNFVPLIHHQRPALLLSNGIVYVGFGSHGDRGNYQGWLFGYDAATLARKFVTTLTDPTTSTNRGAVWQGGAGPAVDSSGNVYVSTGNGTYDGTKNFGDSTVKLSPTGAILDWFTPFNQSTFNANDIDLGSGGVLILPNSVGSTTHPQLALATGKVAILYLLDQNNMGKFNSTSNNDVQEVTPVPPPNTTMFNGGNYGVPAYWNGNIYTTGQSFPLSQFHISNGAISTPQLANSSNTFPPRGGVAVVSASGTTNGIVWILDLTGWQFANTPAILDAYDATNVGTLLYSSPANGIGAAPPAVKFTIPVVANGKVYVGGQYAFTVFGLLPN
jgi:hypothetical protein